MFFRKDGNAEQESPTRAVIPADPDLLSGAKYSLHPGRGDIDAGYSFNNCNQILALIVLVSADAPRSPAPHADCLDARVVTQVRQLTPNSLIVASGELRHRIELQEQCPDVANGASLLAHDGWVCGAEREFVKTAQQLCAIKSVSPISTRDYSQLTRAADQQASVAGELLPAVEAHGKRSAQRGFRGSFEYCFRPSLVRGWAADSDGILIQTSKKRSGGYAAYRVELGGSCPQTAYLPNLTLRSGVGLDLICGNAGDLAVLSGEQSHNGGMLPTADANEAVRSVLARPTIMQQGCPIVAVYPVHD